MINEHTIYVEKYRPDSLDNFITNDNFKNKLKSFIQEQDIPHLLFSGKAGCGKTTLAKILVKNIECDYLYINASDENSVDTIRNKIKGFVTTLGFKSLKIVILDESDFVTVNGQAALRNLMETFSKNARFILTCNYLERIIDPIISRCQSFQLIPPSQKEVAVHVASILKKENIKFNPEDIKTLVVSYYPDIRRCINMAQMFSDKGELVLDKEQLIGSDVKLNILYIILNETKHILDKFKEIRELIHKEGIRDFSEFYSFLYENLEQFPAQKQPTIILQLAESQKNDSFVVDREINFAAAIYNILKTLEN